MNISVVVFRYSFFIFLFCFLSFFIGLSPGLAEDITPTAGQIYRWVDDNGHVVYSNRPNHSSAESYTPKQIGYIGASNLPERKHSKTITYTRKISKIQLPPSVPKLQPEFKFSTTSAGQKLGYVLLTGRISEGYACERLQVVAKAISDTGRIVRGRDVVSYNGFGSTLYEIKKSSSWKGKGRRPQWDPVSARAVCLDN